MTIGEILQQARPVLPVITLSGDDQALPLADALVAGGVSVLEVTLRTEYGLPAIEQLSRHRGDMLVGAGSVTEPDQLAAVRDAGAVFAVSPGFSVELSKQARQLALPLLPGVMTPSEMLQARAMGHRHLKLFPADVAGGIAMLKAVNGPLADLVFCPTGGIGPDNYRQFLALGNVCCVGGSWLAPAERVEAGDWAAIEQLARRAVAI